MGIGGNHSILLGETLVRCMLDSAKKGFSWPG